MQGGLFSFAVAGRSFIFSTTAPLSNISDFNSEGRAQFPTLYFIVTSYMGGGLYNISDYWQKLF